MNFEERKSDHLVYSTISLWMTKILKSNIDIFVLVRSALLGYKFLFQFINRSDEPSVSPVRRNRKLFSQIITVNKHRTVIVTCNSLLLNCSTCTVFKSY